MHGLNKAIGAWDAPYKKPEHDNFEIGSKYYIQTVVNFALEKYITVANMRWIRHKDYAKPHATVPRLRQR